MEATLVTKSSQLTTRGLTNSLTPWSISSTPDGARGISIYGNEPPFNEADFVSVIAVLKANYSTFKEDTPDNAMFFSTLRVAAHRKGFSATRLKEAVMNHIMESRYPPKVSEIVEFDRLIEVLGWRKVEDLPWPHEPVAKIFLPNGNFEFCWEKDIIPEYGYKWEHYITPAERNHNAEVEASKISDEERRANFERLDKMIKDFAKNG